MARSTISIVLRCAVLLVVIVEVRVGVPVATRPPPVRHGSQKADAEVEPQPTGHHCGGESLVLEVAEARSQVQRSLDRLDDLEDALKLHVTDERVVIQISLATLAGIEARLTERNVCSSNQCQNGGTCVDENTSFRCACVTGYTGVYCDLNVDECWSNPCQNGATCSDGVNGFACICAEGYSGTTCGINIDECSSDPCQNGATCVDGVNGYTCTCVSGYTGTYCGVDVDECWSNPCQNGATCSDGVNGFTCICAEGYSGTICGMNIDECSSDPCQNGATCVDGVNGYTCTCVSGYTGTYCGVDVDECWSNPCQNGATCSDGVNGFTCICAEGYSGTICGMNIDECSSDPCQNGATCVVGVNGYTCTCVSGYTGTSCEVGVDECASNPCATGATCCATGAVCMDEVDGYTCICDDTDVDKCASNLCPTGATCLDGADGYSCICDTSTVTHRDCKEVMTEMCSVSGVYTVTPRGGTPTQVYCDMDTAGGGWLVFEKRVDGSVDFYRNWETYAAGFGDLNGEFWLGNRNLHLLTAQKNYTLKVVLSDWEGNQRYAQSTSFTIGSEQDKFRLTVGGYSGDAGDALRYSSGRPFSARDQDNDEWYSHCAQLYRGAWWYSRCGRSNLNGRYYPAGPYTAAQSQTGWEDGMWWGG